MAMKRKEKEAIVKLGMIMFGITPEQMTGTHLPRKSLRILHNKGLITKEYAMVEGSRTAYCYWSKI